MKTIELIEKLQSLPDEQKEMEVRFCEILNEYDSNGFYIGEHCYFYNLDNCEVVVHDGEVRICIEED